MNLAKLFETQKVLRDRIGYEGPDRFEKLILALLVEVGECANEWRGFKFWSKNQEARVFVPNPKDVCKECDGQGMLNTHLAITDPDREFCDNCDGCGVHFHNALLEEYVDGLHFVLEIGLEREKTKVITDFSEKRCRDTVTEQFNALFDVISNYARYRTIMNYTGILSLFLGLGEMLGFTWEQIEQAYSDKNQVNHVRQDTGY